MTIEVRQPELKALILDLMRKGEFKSIEDVLLQALKASPLLSQDAGKNLHRCIAIDSSDIGAGFRRPDDGDPFRSGLLAH